MLTSRYGTLRGLSWSSKGRHACAGMGLPTATPQSPVKRAFSAIKCFLYQAPCWSRGAGVTMKGVSAFLDMRPCKDGDHETRSRKDLNCRKTCCPSFPGAQGALLSTLNAPGRVRGQQLQQHGQMANAPGKCQLAADRIPVSILPKTPLPSITLGSFLHALGPC